jgi:DNA-binding NarL/FixJ family response regulator
MRPVRLAKEHSDPLAIVEAGYDLAADDDAWIARLTRAVSRDLLGPLGTVGYGFQHAPGFRYALRGISVSGGEPILAQLTRSVVGSFPVEDLTNFFRQRGVTTTTLSCRAPLPAQSTERGLVEFCGLVVGDETNGVVIGAPVPEVTRLSPHARLRWRRISAHLTAVHRLRTALSAARPHTEEALLSTGARLVHATGAVARSRDARRALREAVTAMEKARGPLRRSDPVKALQLWRELVGGRWTIVEKIESCGRRLLVAHANPPDATRLRELSPTEHRVLRALLEGGSVARIASSLGSTASAVSHHIDRLLQKFRLRSTSELLTLAARLRKPWSVSRLSVNGLEAIVVDTGPRPETILARRLTAAERQIAGLILDGLSTAEVAELRRCAYRTVANHLASIYGKLGVGSRTELGAYVARLDAGVAATNADSFDALRST